MLTSLMLKGLKHGKTRFLCAVAGVAISAGTLSFTSSLVTTHARQAPVLARRASAPWAAWKLEGIQMMRRGMPPPGARGKDRPSPDARGKGRPGQAHPADKPAGTASPPTKEVSILSLTLDYRPGGRVLQGPPMHVLMAKAPAENPYAKLCPLVEGRWPAAGGEAEFVALRKSLRRGPMPPPPLGTKIKFLGRRGTMTATLVGYLDGPLPPPSHFPTVFATPTAFDTFNAEKPGTLRLWSELPPDAAKAELLTPESPEVTAGYTSDEQRRQNYARPLLMVAALLTALALLVNSLLISVESNRPTLARLRLIGLTRSGVVRFVLLEAFFTAILGGTVGVGLASLALSVYVGIDPAAFPVGMFVDAVRIVQIFAILAAIVPVAVGFVLWPACKVRPLDTFATAPRRRHWGMALTFGCGFAAFVAVEVWGASLMRGFVPSPEWPDAIVSLLPGGISSFDISKFRKIEGVKRIAELLPLQIDLATDPPAEPMPDKPGMRMRGRPNALFLASEWLPRFRFIEGTWEEADADVRDSDACVITEMMSRAQKLHAGDCLKVRIGRGPDAETVELPIAGVVDLNWHMVTSRGLVRGLNGAPGMTDGPVFCSLDTLESLDMRPAPMVNMTHLWVEYEPDFLAKHGVFPAGRKVEAAIAAALGNPTDFTVRLHARDEIADGTLSHGSDLIGQAARVPFIFLFVLALGFVAMLVAEAEAQRKTFRILRAVGATRLQCTMRLAKVALKTALIGIVCGVPAGALIGWLFAHTTGAVWPGMPHYFVLPAQIVIEGACGAVIASLLFAIPTSLALVISRTRR